MMESKGANKLHLSRADFKAAIDRASAHVRSWSPVREPRKAPHMMDDATIEDAVGRAVEALEGIRDVLERIADRLDDAASMAVICGRNTPPPDDRQPYSTSDPGRVPFGLSTHTPPLPACGDGEDDLWRDVEARNRRALFTGEVAGQSTPRY